jgi:formate dehydrogenase assembly factor FdhD
VELSRLVQYARFENGHARPSEGNVVREALVRLHVNGQELVRLMCTPEQLDYLALGFLRSEGLISELSDVRLLVICPSRACVDVWLRDAEAQLPGMPSVTSGCGGGITFADLEAAGEPVRSNRILLTTGRISSEMLGKAARMGCPIVVSRTSPTSLSAALAEAWKITLVGYVRRTSMNVYTGQERVLVDEEVSTDAKS